MSRVALIRGADRACNVTAALEAIGPDMICQTNGVL